MKYVAEITLRSVPFEAEAAEEARRVACAELLRELKELGPLPQVVDVQVFEHTEMDG